MEDKRIFYNFDPQNTRPEYYETAGNLKDAQLSCFPEQKPQFDDTEAELQETAEVAGCRSTAFKFRDVIDLQAQGSDALFLINRPSEYPC